MKRGISMLVVGMVVGVLGGCGVPGEAGRLARVEVGVLAELPLDDAGVRRELAGQVAVWERLVGLLDRRELGGVAVGEDFVVLVREAAALARRQKEIMDAGEDEAGLNRAALEKLRGMWGSVRGYLGG